MKININKHLISNMSIFLRHHFNYKTEFKASQFILGKKQNKLIIKQKLKNEYKLLVLNNVLSNNKHIFSNDLETEGFKYYIKKINDLNKNYKYKKFNYKKDSIFIYSNPVKIDYNNYLNKNNNVNLPILNKYLSSRLKYEAKLKMEQSSVSNNILQSKINEKRKKKMNNIRNKQFFYYFSNIVAFNFNKSSSPYGSLKYKSNNEKKVSYFKLFHNLNYKNNKINKNKIDMKNLYKNNSYFQKILPLINFKKDKFINDRMYFYNWESKKLINDLYKVLASSFKSMSCLISNTFLSITPDKVKIYLFYYKVIPSYLNTIYKRKFLIKRKIERFANINNFFINKSTNYLYLIENKTNTLNSNKLEKLIYTPLLKSKDKDLNKNLIQNKDNIRIYKKLLKKKLLYNFRKKYLVRKLFFKFKNLKFKLRKKLLKLKDKNLILNHNNKFIKLCNLFNRFFSKPVEFDLIRLHYPYMEGNILVNLLGIFINKIRIKILIRKLYKKIILKKIFNHRFSPLDNFIQKDDYFNYILSKKINKLPAFIGGLNIKIAGRLSTQRVKPRITVFKFSRGAVARGKTDFFNMARFTHKNKRGAYSVTVHTGHILNK